MKYIKFAICLVLIFPVTSYAADPYSNEQGYMGAPSISRGKGIVIAVIDDGVWQEHPDLTGSSWLNTKEIPSDNIDNDLNGYVDDYYGWNFVDGNSGMDPYGTHGTMVAGIITAQHNDIGVAGIAPDSKIMSLIACDKNGCSADFVKNAIKYAVNNGANIINLSLGSRGYLGYSNSYDESIKYAYDQGVAVIASAGNGDINSSGQVGQNLDFLRGSPVSNDVNGFNTVIGVGATRHSSSDRTNWSNYGEKYVDVWANGEEVLSTSVPKYSNSYGYSSKSGTSFSAPIISGYIALLMSIDRTLKLYEIIDILKQNNGSSAYKLLTNSIYASSCAISSFNLEVKNGEKITLPARSLRHDAEFELYNSISNRSLVLQNAISIVDSNKLILDTSIIKIPEGVYNFRSTNSSKIKCLTNQWNSLSVKGEYKIGNSKDVEVSKNEKITIVNSEESQKNDQKDIATFLPATQIFKDNETKNSEIITKIFSFRDGQSQLSPDQEKIRSKTTIDEKIAKNFDVYFPNIKLTADWAVSKLNNSSIVDSIILTLENEKPVYVIHQTRNEKFLGLFKVVRERKIIFHTDDLNQKPRGEKKFFDFLYGFSN